ncbi:MAG TPA: hypothetical protein VIU42_06140 [Xanthobacteraceae bacterium]|jgi:hypothetical protein
MRGCTLRFGNFAVEAGRRACGVSIVRRSQELNLFDEAAIGNVKCAGSVVATAHDRIGERLIKFSAARTFRSRVLVFCALRSCPATGNRQPVRQRPLKILSID